ncbi:ATP-binding protein [Candidatus Saccharibacteria bacterium]|nr:ATP-binding protein [Candidatus Saccharibacteria bacterium]
MIKRPLYLDKLESYIDKPFIKVLAGVRRAGKSSLLEQLIEVLKSRGVKANKIAYINFDSIDYTGVRTKKDLVELEKNLLKLGVKYFLFDEVQNVEQWDEAISALFAEKGVDIFITGSNSKMLSSELSTFFTGRYVDIRVSTLNFEEALEFKKARGAKIGEPKDEFMDYLSRGGFPSIHLTDQTQAQDDEEVSDIVNSIIYRDLVERKGIRNTELLNRVIRFVLDNLGSTMSANSISNYLKNEKLTLSQETIYKYLNWLEETLIIERVSRLDLRGKEQLKTQEKYYASDIAFLYALNGRSETYLSGVLENVVYHELIAKGYTVGIGKNGEKEIDFVAEKDHKRIYLQVAAHLDSRSTSEREFGAFDGIEDNYPKYVLTLDDDWAEEHQGIEQKFLPDFLLNDLK